MPEPNKNHRVFIAVFIVFTLIIALVAVDMASRTTAPWNKPKQLQRATPGGVAPGALPISDSLLLDSMLLNSGQ